MPLIETEALILRSYNLAEADKIVVFITRNEGVVRGVAKGAKRLKSRFGSGLEPFSKVKIEYFLKESSELVTIQRVELTSSSFTAASDPEFLRRFSYLSELLVLFSPPHDPNEKLYRMVNACIDAAAGDSANLDGIVLYFEIWLLRLSGFLQDWSTCGACLRTFDDADQAYLAADLSLICKGCCPGSHRDLMDARNRHLAASARRLSPRDFAQATVGLGDRIGYLSEIMKRSLSRAAGKDISAERSLAIKFM